MEFSQLRAKPQGLPNSFTIRGLFSFVILAIFKPRRALYSRTHLEPSLQLHDPGGRELFLAKGLSPISSPRPLRHNQGSQEKWLQLGAGEAQLPGGIVRGGSRGKFRITNPRGGPLGGSGRDAHFSSARRFPCGSFLSHTRRESPAAGLMSNRGCSMGLAWVVWSVRKNTHRACGFSVFLLIWRSRLAGGASRPPDSSGRGAGAIFIMVDRRPYLKYDFAL